MRLKFLLGPIPNALSAGFVTVAFVLFFVGLCWFVYRKDRRALYKTLERLPLEENNHG
jgi:cbb3-type cytochrome oxidase subunit 3